MWEKGIWSWHSWEIWKRMADPYKGTPVNINLDWAPKCADIARRGKHVDAPWLHYSSREVSQTLRNRQMIGPDLLAVGFRPSLTMGSWTP